jgi:hypothetical protein
MPDTKEEIERRMDELAREYGRTPRGDPRRAEIAKQLSELCLMPDRLAATDGTLRKPIIMGVPNALIVLEDAVDRCMTDNVETPAVLAALDFLDRQATVVKWPFDQFRKALAPKEGELDLNREGRRQILNASLNGIKRAVLPKIGARH